MILLSLVHFQSMSTNYPFTKYVTIIVYKGLEGEAPHILDSDTQKRWVVRFMFWPLYSGGKNL
jgi:hypothetical protein